MKTVHAHSGRTTLKAVISLVLCLCMITSVVQMFIIGTYSVSDFDVTVTYDGKAIDEINILQSDKKELRAEISDTGRTCTYRWQVLADAENDTWVDIYDADGSTLTVSYGLVSSVLDMSGSAYVRCTATGGSTHAESSPVCVNVIYEAGAGSADAYAASVYANADADVPSVISDDIVSITVNYLDAVSGVAIYMPFRAQIEKGTSYENSVISPTYLGYAPYYNSQNPAETFPKNGEVNAPDDALIVLVSIGEDYTDSTYIVNVYYKAINVPYAARYYFQNINDDFYTENVGLYRQGTAKTGTIISDEALNNIDHDLIKGFTKLYHYPEAVAADGSTVFECYYDRNYYMLRFDAAGGYGSENIYARYDTPFIMNAPTKHGYVFVGWDLLTNGEGDGKPDSVPSTVPAENQSWKALWKAVETSYTVVYWLENADDSEYSYIGSEKIQSDSGVEAYPADILTADTYICGNTTHTHTDDCKPENFKHYVYDSAKTNEVNSRITVRGDGSSTLNIYYTRKYYTLRFIYAKEYNGLMDFYSERDASNTFTGIRYSIVGGSTHLFGNKDKAWPKTSVKGDYTFENLIYNMDDREGNQWGTIYETDSQTEDYSKLPQINNPDNCEYNTGVYPEDGKGYNGGNYTQRGDRFYYFDLTAKFGADITDLWPVEVFDNVQVAYPDKHIDNGGYKNEWGKYAYLAGWNGEFKVNYSLDNNNSTVKGKYQKLNDTLLFGDAYSYTDALENREITTTSTVEGKEVTSYVNYYLNFFSNGTGVRWNVPRQWIYELYVPIFTNELSEDDYNTVVAAGKPIELENQKTYYYYNNIVYRLYDSCVTSDDNTSIANNAANSRVNQTQTSLDGFEFVSGVLSYPGRDKTARSEFVDNGTLADNRRSFTARFFYVRDTYALTMHNYNKVYNSYQNVEFDSVLNGYVLNEDGTSIYPGYPETLEKNAYNFSGWYTSPGCYEGSEYISGTKMPSSNMALYAGWKPTKHTVMFFQTYDDMLAYRATGNTDGLIETRIVEHRNTLETVNNPTDEKYTFNGWFYMSSGKKTAYTPLDMEVVSDMYVFADWGSNQAQPYKIHYALYKGETDEQWLKALNEAAGSTPEDNYLYTVTLGDDEREYVYLKSDGAFHLQIADLSYGYAYQGNTRTFHPKAGDPFNQLYKQYNSGYYPTVASHSITIAYEENKEDPRVNVFTFLYVNADSIDYTVEYIYRDTGLPIPDAPGGGQVEKSTSLAVVTERFAVVPDYIPDAFYKRLILAVTVDEKGNVSSSPDNKITFYYSNNTANAYYAVHTMLQNPDAESDSIDRDSSGNFVNYTESGVGTEGIGDVGKTVKIVPQTFSGFTVYKNGIARGEDGDSERQLTIADDGDGKQYFEITVRAEGTEVYIFYTRKVQNYKVYYLRYGTDISDLSKLEFDADDASHKNGVLHETYSGSARFGTNVTRPAEEISGMNCVSSPTQTISIRSDDSQNYIVFFYAPLRYTVEYRVWKYGGGQLDNTIEVKNGADSYNGSAPTALEGYVFEGWYIDPDCTVPAVSNPASDTDKATVNADDNRLTPKADKLEPSPSVNVFYAKFMPVFGDLTITRNNGTSDESSGDRVFVYKISAVDDDTLVTYVTITGNGSVTVKGLGCREYTVEQQNGWSWRYGDTSKNVKLTKYGAEVEFSDSADNSSWLSGNSKPIKNTKG